MPDRSLEGALPAPQATPKTPTTSLADAGQGSNVAAKKGRRQGRRTAAQHRSDEMETAFYCPPYAKVKIARTPAPSGCGDLRVELEGERQRTGSSAA